MRTHSDKWSLALKGVKVHKGMNTQIVSSLFFWACVCVCACARACTCVCVCPHEFLHIMCEQGPPESRRESQFSWNWNNRCVRDAECWNQGFCERSKWTSLLITISYFKSFCVFFFNNVLQTQILEQWFST